MHRARHVACPACLAALAVLAGCYRVQMSGLSYEPQEGWLREDPTSESRMVQYRLRSARQSGEPDARLVIYYFGPQGAGDVPDNVARWCRQFEQPGGRESNETAQVSRCDVNGLEVHEVALSGIYDVTKPGSDERFRAEGYAMEAAVVKTAAGPYYFKLVGPQATVERWKPSYDTLLASLRPAGVSPAPKPG